MIRSIGTSILYRDESIHRTRAVKLRRKIKQGMFKKGCGGRTSSIDFNERNRNNNRHKHDDDDGRVHIIPIYIRINKTSCIICVLIKPFSGRTPDGQ